MKILLAAAAFALTSVAALPALAADNNSFILSTKGRVVGKASYTIDKVKEGYRVRSRYEFHIHGKDISSGANDSDDSMPQGRGSAGGGNGMIDGQFNAEYKLSPEGNFLGGYLQDGNSQSMIAFTPSKARDTYTMTLSQGGSMGQPRILPSPKTDYGFVPNFDPGGLQALLTTAIAHPREDRTYLLLIPGNTSRQPPNMLYVAFDPAQGSSATGTLDGKPVELKHYTLRFHSGDADVYTDAEGKLMEADLNQMSTTYVRAKFALDAKK